MPKITLEGLNQYLCTSYCDSALWGSLSIYIPVVMFGMFISKDQ